MRTIEVRSVIPLSPKELWSLLDAPENVLTLAPKWLHVSLTGDGLNKMYKDQRLNFTLKPFGIVKMTWVTIIKEIEDGIKFIDEQEGGPFRYWRHEHIIENEKGQTIMLDRLTFETKLSWIPFFDSLIASPFLRSSFKSRYKNL